MKTLICFLFATTHFIIAQNTSTLSPLDGRAWGVVLQHPLTKEVKVKSDVIFLNDEKGILKMDVYSPPAIKKGEQRPAIIFLNAIGDQPGEMKVKNWGIYSSWPRLMAAYGYVGISMECDATRVQESLQGIFNHLEHLGTDYNIDANRIGVYAASANVSQSVNYLMRTDAYEGIKAAVLYYGGAPQGPFRKDLPVYFVIAEGDVPRNNYSGLWTEVLKNNAPWTIQMGTNLIHAFDAFSDNDNARRLIKATISFWQNNLDPVPSLNQDPNSMGRKILEAQYSRNDQHSIELIERWIPDHPNDPIAYYNYATSLKNVGRHEESARAFRKVIEFEPNNTQALVYLYLELQILGNPAEAQPFLERAEQSGHINKFMYMGVAFTLYGLNKHQEGVRFFEKVVQEDPSGINLYNLACGYARIGDKRKAIGTLQRSIDAGFNSRNQLEKDTDLDSLREEADFEAILSKLN